MSKKIIFLIIIVTVFSSENIFATNFYDRTVAIDPGHGGKDPGSLGFDGASLPNEADIVLEIAKKLSNRLEQSNASVVMTRKTSDSMTDNGKGSGSAELRARVKYINQKNPEAFISIHLNSYSQINLGGTETLYHPQGTTQDKELAKIVQDKIVDVVQKDDRGVKQKYLTILGVNSSIPAVVSEGLFIQNEDEFDFIKKDSNKDKFANAYYNSFKDFLKAPEHDIRMFSEYDIDGDIIISGKPLKITLNIANYGYGSEGIFKGNIALSLHSSSGTFLGDIERFDNVTFNSEYSQSISFYKSTINSSPGNYQLHLKVQDDNGRWSLVNPNQIEANPKDVTIYKEQFDYIDKCHSKYKYYFGEKVGSKYSCGNGFICQLTNGNWNALAVYEDNSYFYIYANGSWYGSYTTSYCD